MAVTSVALDMKGAIPDEDYRFAMGLAAARPIEDLAAEMGWTLAKAKRKVRDNNVLAAVAAEGLTKIHGILIPLSLDLLAALVSDQLFTGEKGGLQSLQSVDKGAVSASKGLQILQSPPAPKHVPVSVAIRLQAAQTVLKIARMEDVQPPRDPESSLGDDPDRLKALLDAIEGKLADLAKPIGAETGAVSDAPVPDLPSNYSVL